MLVNIQQLQRGIRWSSERLEEEDDDEEDESEHYTARLLFISLWCVSVGIMNKNKLVLLIAGSLSVEEALRLMRKKPDKGC